MKKNKIFLMAALPVAMSLQIISPDAAAQNSNPTVVVTRDYSASLDATRKMDYSIINPAGAGDFDISFDYSIFETSYLGAYDFSPYMIRMRPELPKVDERTFYVNAGIGYTLRPELDFIWSPTLFKEAASSSAVGNLKRLRFNLYGSHHSYIGNYAEILPKASGSVARLGATSGKDSGFDLNTNLGASLCYDGAKGSLVFEAGWKNLAFRAMGTDRMDNVFETSVSAKSLPRVDPHFFYDIDFAYSHLNDRSVVSSGDIHLGQDRIKFFSSLGRKKGSERSLLVDTDFDYVGYDASHPVHGVIRQGVYLIAAKPHFVMTKGMLSLDLGLKASVAFDSPAGTVISDISTGQIAYPDLRLRMAIPGPGMVVSARIWGDNTVNAFSDVLAGAHYYNLDLYRVLKNSMVPLAASGSISGSLFNCLDWSAGVKAAFVRNGLLPSLVENPSEDPTSPEGYLSTFDFASYAFVEGNADIRMTFPKWNSYFKFTYTGSRFHDSVAPVGLFLPAPYRAYGEVEYKFTPRLSAALCCDFRSDSYAATPAAMPYSHYRIPHSENLGLRMDFLSARGIRLWARGSNLLFQDIQLLPLLCEKGPSLTLGAACRF